MLANINYRGILDQKYIMNMKFPHTKPQQIVDRSGKHTIIIFKTGKCRIMGCKKPIRMQDLQYNIKNIVLQSITVTVNVGHKIHLLKLENQLQLQCMYEPELFPALRFLKYNPLCVNIFSSGKVVILGLPTLQYHQRVESIINDIKTNVI